ncbi:hypothetical protein AB4071_01750 [Stenotrophomonas sp. 2MCAF14_2]|uniref:hypothetical protein n=1 Tax=Stenotrophomonas sp. 2MCAF14_2 TaxID=3232983 RepID=UPI003F98EEFC
MTYAQIGEAIGSAGSTVGDLASGRSQSPRAAAALALLKLYAKRAAPECSAAVTRPVVGRISKRALREKLGLSTDMQLAKVLKLPTELVETWAEEDQVPSIPQVLRLLGIEEPPPSMAPVIHDPDANRIGPVDTA